MTETTRDIICTFSEGSKRNAVKLGVRQSVKFTKEGIIVEGEAENALSFFDFTAISAEFRLYQLVRMLRSVRESPSGTTVVFIHRFGKELVEGLVGQCGFRVYEHFSVTRVIRALCAEEEKEDISYCLAVRK